VEISLETLMLKIFVKARNVYDSQPGKSTIFLLNKQESRGAGNSAAQVLLGVQKPDR
jgi:hypothetical protein